MHAAMQLRARRALASAQAAYDNALPDYREDDAREAAQESMAARLDEREPALVQAWAEHANTWVTSEQVHGLLVGLLSLDDRRWEHLRHAMREDRLAEPLHALWLHCQALRGEFIDEQIEREVAEHADV